MLRKGNEMTQTTYTFHPYRPGTRVQRDPIPRNGYEMSQTIYFEDSIDTPPSND